MPNGRLSDLHRLVLHWVGEHSRDGVRPEHAARELRIDLASRSSFYATWSGPA
jgi:hypothetical protein